MTPTSVQKFMRRNQFKYSSVDGQVAAISQLKNEEAKLEGVKRGKGAFRPGEGGGGSRNIRQGGGTLPVMLLFQWHETAAVES